MKSPRYTPHPIRAFEVMEEQQVTVDGVSVVFPAPFLSLPPRTPSSTRHFSPPEDGSLHPVFELGYPTEIEELQMLQRLADGVTVTDLQPCASIMPAVRSSPSGKLLTAVHPQLGFEPRGRMKKLPWRQSSWYRSFTTSNSGSSFSY